MNHPHGPYSSDGSDSKGLEATLGQAKPQKFAARTGPEHGGPDPDEEAGLALTEDRRARCGVLGALAAVLAAVASLSLAPNALAQGCAGCLGDIAGQLTSSGAQLPDGLINEFDVIELIRIVDTTTFDTCADMDMNQVLTLGPIVLDGIWYPGDLDLMFAAFGVCNDVCMKAAGDLTKPCELPHLGIGCNDPLCCALVCELAPHCCNTDWDGACAATAAEVCSTEAGSCLLTSTSPGCLDTECEFLVCNWDPDGDGTLNYAYCCELAWDRHCVEAAGDLCTQTFCDQLYLGDCSEAHAGPSCEVFFCAETVCLEHPHCCTTTWDETCVAAAQALCYCPFSECGDPFSGKCTIAHFGPGCNDGACCTLVCLIDPYCCEIAWDVTCALAATEACPSEFGTCGRFNPTPCRSVLPPFAPGCNDFNCCNSVCQVDAYCCAAQWDVTCALLAWEVCSTYDICGELGTGSCRIEHKTPGCDDEGCCDQVCNIDPSCCEMEWDITCVGLANFQCNGCGDLGAGSCFNSDNGTPACNDEFCCDAVCVIDMFCCTDQWDSICVTIAENSCFDPLNYCGSALARSCFVPSITQGCSDASCCEDICRSFDSFCCEVNWDAICVTTAFSLDACNLGLPTGGRGDCLEPHSLPGCAVPSCSAAVCEIYPTCCELSWSQWCADAAAELCFDLVICPGEGACMSSNSTPGCEDPWCCNIVCKIDQICCDQIWDNSCVLLALDLCDGAALPNCPCAGDCFDVHGNPGCELESCCTAVCTLDGDDNGIPDFPECCEVEWDAFCAVLAKDICCEGETCGTLCAGSCLESNGTPNCDDPACCDAVCQLDPYCCNINWDGRCVVLAEERCRRGCGVPTAGSCFVSKATPGCADPECCAAICEDVDPFCCEVVWDVTCTQEALLECDVPECGDYTTGPCCETHDGPACDNRRCCDDVCDMDPYCCESTWDNVCVYLARQSDDCECSYECGDICAGSCCEANGTPGCDDEDCCELVCLLDLFCCTNEWDIYCAQAAIINCSGQDEACPAPECGDPVAGSCCYFNGSPSCNEKKCCEAICDDDPYCCEVEWDETCAQRARSDDYEDECPCGGGLSCGDPGAGSCDEAHEEPYCNDEACCEAVCVVDPACCIVAWDESCVAWAKAFCD